MVHSILTSAVGTVAGSIIGVYFLFQMGIGGGFPDLIEVIVPAFAGATTASPLGVFSGITGGIVGGLVGAAFVILFPAWLFTGTPLSSLLASIVVAFTLSTSISLFFPH